jgi:hypothetical protein
MMEYGIEQKVRARRGDFNLGEDCIEIHLYQRRNNSQCKGTFVPKPIEMEKLETNAFISPFFKMEPHEAQKLMDDLWDCGLRPSEGTGSAGALKAVQNHLADIKTIAFHALKIQDK